MVPFFTILVFLCLGILGGAKDTKKILPASKNNIKAKVNEK